MAVILSTWASLNRRFFSDKSARDTFFFYSGATPSAVRYKNWKMYYTMAQGGAQGWIQPLIPYHFTLVQNILRDLAPADWERSAPEATGDTELARAAGVERSEFMAARQRLAAAGYHLCDEEAAWRSFVKYRAVYAAALNTLAHRFGTPATQWIGGRSTPTDPHHREGASPPASRVDKGI